MSSRYFFKNGDTDLVVDNLRQFLYARWYLTTIPKYKVCSTVFDSSMTAMITRPVSTASKRPRIGGTSFQDRDERRLSARGPARPSARRGGLQRLRGSPNVTHQ